MHEFSRGSRACSSGKFLNLHSLKCHFLDFGERFYRILIVRKRHCNISEALANVFALSPKPGGGAFGPLRLGAPGFSRSEPIVVTLLPGLTPGTALRAVGSGIKEMLYKANDLFEQHYKHKVSQLKQEEQKIVLSLKLFHPEQIDDAVATANRQDDGNL
jgi:hypothetical protein